MTEIRLENDEIIARNQKEYLNSIQEILEESKKFKENMKNDHVKTTDKIYYRED